MAVTRAIDSIEFTKPVHVGNWVNFESRIIKTGNSSIVIQVDAYKENHEEDKNIGLYRKIHNGFCQEIGSRFVPEGQS